MGALARVMQSMRLLGPCGTILALAAHRTPSTALPLRSTAGPRRSPLASFFSNIPVRSSQARSAQVRPLGSEDGGCLRIAHGLLAAVLVLPGCATIVTGTDHTMAVASEPAGAVCQLERGGDVIGYVNSTPANASFSKSSRPIQVSCGQRDGRMYGTSTVDPGFQPWVLGNVIIGGLLGLFIDISSGAVASYPPNTTVVLTPTRDPAPTTSLPSEAPGKPMS